MTKNVNNFSDPYLPTHDDQDIEVSSRRESSLECTNKDIGEQFLLIHPLAIKKTFRNNDFSSPPLSQKMEVLKIHFTQVSVSPYFSDGRKVADVAQQLASGTISADDIPLIRVVRYQNRIWTLDNRRLRAFRDGFVDTTKVTMLDLKDLDVAEEFWNKKSSKSLAVGGTVRNEYPEDLDRQHFEQGIYVFNKHVLNWTFEQIDQPMPCYNKISLPNRYNNRDEYYRSFENLIFEEARAILQVGIQQATLQQKHTFQFSLIRFKRAKTAENPTEIKFSILPDSERDVKSGDVLLLEHADYPQLRLIALSNYCSLDHISPELSFKVVVDIALLRQFPFAFDKDQKWNAKALGSLITLQRMYETCTTFGKKELTFLEACIVSGTGSLRADDLDKLQDKHYQSDPSKELQMLSTLNLSQKKVVAEFLRLDQGLQLVQGPPGTGKTTTVIRLLGALQEQKEKVLVCAPSNKAVHILAKRFIREHPNVPVILLGVEQKLPSDGTLNCIFLDLWCSQKVHCLTKMSELLWKFQPQKLMIGNVKFLPNRTRQACQDLQQLSLDFSSFVNDIERYNLTCLKGLLSESSKLSEAIYNYCSLLSAQEPTAWKEVGRYYAQEQGRPPSFHMMPSFVSVARSYLSTVSIILSSLKEKLLNAEADYSNIGLEAELLNHSQIVFATLSVSGQKKLNNIDFVDTLVVDEAGQAVEAETLIALRVNPRKCLLIGDIQQLPATVISRDAEKLKFGRSMMERLIKDCEQPFFRLKMQYRMHPEISSWPSKQYYQSELVNHESVCSEQYIIKELGNSLPFLAPYAFIDIDGKETKDPFRYSFVNLAEVNIIASIINYMSQKLLINVVTRIAIITFYAAQVDRIYETLKDRYPGIRVNTVDGFQGDESDIVIISFVRANFEKQIGFLRDFRRLNVAITRAKFSLILLGNKATLMCSDIAELVANADARNFLYKENVLQKLILPKTKISAPVNSQQTRKKLNHSTNTDGLNKHKANKSSYKTQLCRFYISSYSSCTKGARCTYAHGTDELRKRSFSTSTKVIKK